MHQHLLDVICVVNGLHEFNRHTNDLLKHGKPLDACVRKSSAACHLADLNLQHVQHASPTWNHAIMQLFTVQRSQH